MSWSISFMGRPKAVAAKIREYASGDGSKCAEPEETIRQRVCEAAAIAAENQAEGIAVKVDANGSMWRDADRVKTNNVQLSVQPLHGFVE